MTRTHIASGSPFEARVGFSRAVRVGNFVFVAGTAPIAVGGGVAAPGNVYGQTRRCIAIAEAALHEAGAALRHVVRTRVMLTDMSRWEEAARAHGEAFAEIRPAATFVAVSGFIDPAWLVEIEFDALID